MRDSDIRWTLRRQLEHVYSSEPSTRIVEELGICNGVARVDVAVLNGEIKGFEIKSERDTLIRLPAQCQAYGKVFDTMTIVASENHIEKVGAVAPHWWGVVVARISAGNLLEMEVIREELRNEDQQSFAIAQLLWRDEAMALLSEAGLANGLRGRRREFLWDALASNFGSRELAEMVRRQLKARQGWRVAESQTPCDERSQPSSMS